MYSKLAGGPLHVMDSLFGPALSTPQHDGPAAIGAGLHPARCPLAGTRTRQGLAVRPAALGACTGTRFPSPGVFRTHAGSVLRADVMMCLSAPNPWPNDSTNVLVCLWFLVMLTEYVQVCTESSGVCFSALSWLPGGSSEPASG